MTLAVHAILNESMVPIRIVVSLKAAIAAQDKLSDGLTQGIVAKPTIASPEWALHLGRR
jgi:hypothetical protein